MLGYALACHVVTVVGSNAIAAPADVLHSLEDSFSAVLDDILGAYGVSQVALAGDTTTVTTQPFGLRPE